MERSGYVRLLKLRIHVAEDKANLVYNSSLHDLVHAIWGKWKKLVQLVMIPTLLHVHVCYLVL